MRALVKTCFFCGCKHEAALRIGRNDVCDNCGRDLHSCVQCRFYEKGVYHDCLEPNAEWTSDKEKANFCDYFEHGSKPRDNKIKDSSRSKLEALFKKN